MDESNPLAALLAQHSNENTILDEHFKESIAPKIERAAPPKKEIPSEEDDELPIGLTHRQPSFSSLHGSLIGKDGVQVKQLPDLQEDSNADNVIVLDEHDDSDDVPIGLTYRQPSFTSMGGHLVSKGGDCLTDIKPVKTIPIEEAIEEADNEDNNNNNSNNNSNDNDNNYDEEINEEDEEEDLPQVQIVKELKNKNKERWQKMGYEPPPDLIQLTRAQSQSIFDQNRILNNQQPTNPMSMIPLIEEEQPAATNTTYSTAAAAYSRPSYGNANSHSNNNNNPQKILHRRCGSNGMKLGEASTSIVRMSQALMITSDTPNKNISSHEPIHEEEPLGEEEEEENQFEEEEDEYSEGTRSDNEVNHYNRNNNRNNDFSKSPRSYEYSENTETETDSNADHEQEEEQEPEQEEIESESVEESDLFGKLGKIVKEDESSQIYKSIKSGKATRGSDYRVLRQRLAVYIDECIEKLWIDETSYLNKVVESIPSSSRKGKKQGKAPRTSASASISELKAKAKTADEKCAARIESAHLKQENMIEMLNDEYLEAAAELDARFQSQEIISKFNQPSIELINLREQVKQLLRSKKYEAAQSIANKVKSLEAKELREATALLDQKYFEEDRRLKEQFSMKRDLLTRKIMFEIQLLEEDRERKKNKYSAKIAKAKKVAQKHAKVDEDQIEVAKPLDLKAPKRISRENDEKIIELMADHISAGKDVRALDIEKLFCTVRKTKKPSHK